MPTLRLLGSQGSQGSQGFIFLKVLIFLIFSRMLPGSSLNDILPLRAGPDKIVAQGLRGGGLMIMLWRLPKQQDVRRFRPKPGGGRSVGFLGRVRSLGAFAHLHAHAFLALRRPVDAALLEPGLRDVLPGRPKR